MKVLKAQSMEDCIVVKVSLYLLCGFLQYSSARTAYSHVAQLDDQRGGIL